MAFECQRCGECCSHMGLVHQVQEQQSPGVYCLRNTYTGELTTVQVEPDKSGIFNVQETFLELPEACPFFGRDNETGVSICTVHKTRPEICRDFACWKFLIRNNRGETVGRVFSPLTLCSENTHLNKVWEDQIRRIHESGPDWEREMMNIMKREGYTVLR